MLSILHLSISILTTITPNRNSWGRRVKCCKKCKYKKPLEDFPTCRKARDGRTGECKLCRNARCNASRAARSRSLAPPAFKTCIRCAELRPITDFGRQVSQRDGYRNVCGSCFANLPCRQPGSRQVARSREATRRGKVYRTLQQWREYQRQNQRSRNLTRAPSSNIVRDHPDREFARVYRNLLYRVYTYPRTLGYQRLRVKKYKNANPEKVALWAGRRWQRIAEQHDQTVSPTAIYNLFSQATHCPYCGTNLHSDSEKSLDHMDAVALGGVHGLSNLIVCCRQCNQRKSDKPFWEWLANLNEPWRTQANELYARLHN